MVSGGVVSRTLVQLGGRVRGVGGGGNILMNVGSRMMMIKHCGAGVVGVGGS